jgi:hypothetical protein
MADGSGLLSSAIEIENMTLTTEYGDIVFEHPISASNANRYVKGYLLSEEGDIKYFWITAASGIIDGKKTDISKLIHGERRQNFDVITDHNKLEYGNATIEFFDVDKHLLDALIVYGEISTDTPDATTKQLLESARRVLLESDLNQTIYNNDLYYYTYDDGVYLLLITDGATQGFKIIRLKAHQPKDSGEIIFSFTCKIINEEDFGLICTDPEIIENGAKISTENAFKSNPIFLKAFEMFGIFDQEY